MQKFFSRAYDIFFFRYHCLQDFFLDKFPLQESFLGNCHPDSSYFQSVLLLLEDPQIVTMAISEFFPRG